MATSTINSRGRRGAWGHLITFNFAWQACTWGHPITFVFCVAGVALLALLKNPFLAVCACFSSAAVLVHNLWEYCVVYFEVIHGKCA